MLPQNAAYVVRYGEYARDFGELEDIVVVVEAGSFEGARDYAVRLTRELRRSRVKFNRIAYRIDPKRFEGRQLLYLSTGELKEIRDKIFDHQEIMESFAGDPSPVRLLEGINTQMAAAFVSNLFDIGLQEKDLSVDTRFLRVLLDQMSGHQRPAVGASLQVAEHHVEPELGGGADDQKAAAENGHGLHARIALSGVPGRAGEGASLRAGDAPSPRYGSASGRAVVALPHEGVAVRADSALRPDGAGCGPTAPAIPPTCAPRASMLVWRHLRHRRDRGGDRRGHAFEDPTRRAATPPSRAPAPGSRAQKGPEQRDGQCQGAEGVAFVIADRPLVDGARGEARVRGTGSPRCVAAIRRPAS